MPTVVWVVLVEELPNEKKINRPLNDNIDKNGFIDYE